MHTVQNTEQLRLALAAGHKPDQIEMVHPITQAQVDAAVATARAEGVAEGKSVAQADVIAKERKRIADINAIAEEGFEKELAAAVDTGTSAADFALALALARKDRGVTMAAIRRDAPNAAPRANPPKPDATGAKAWDDIYASAAPQKM